MFPFNPNQSLAKANPTISPSMGRQLQEKAVVQPDSAREQIRLYTAETRCRRLLEINAIPNEAQRLAAFHTAAVDFSLDTKLRLEEKALLLGKLCTLAESFSNQSYVAAWTCLMNLYYSADDKLKVLVHAGYDQAYLRSELYGNGGKGWDKTTYQW